jgi:tetratricopeptide (TPR) repeat protein
MPGSAPKPSIPSSVPSMARAISTPLLAATAATKTLALITGIPRKSEPSDTSTSFLDYLNLHRDRIALDRLRLVLFLHTSEAERFMAGAGDLWDFRHHTYWLEGTPAGDGAGLWQTMEETVSKTALSGQDKEEIARHLRETHALIECTVEPAEKAALYLDLSRWLTRHHVPSLGTEAALSGLQMFIDHPSQLRADLEHELGYALWKDHNNSDALTHYKRSLSIACEIGDRSGEGGTLNNISQIYIAWGRNGEALKESLAIFREIGDRSGEGVTCWNLAQEYHRRDDLPKAIEFARRAVEIEEELQHPDAQKSREYLRELEQKLAEAPTPE